MNKRILLFIDAPRLAIGFKQVQRTENATFADPIERSANLVMSRSVPEMFGLGAAR
jgi:hypothetical protein